ncbi:MAG: hypothetical protein WCA32_11620 [Chromatiaceae bacterium]
MVLSNMKPNVAAEPIELTILTGKGFIVLQITPKHAPDKAI